MRGPAPAWVLGLVPAVFLAVFFGWPLAAILGRSLSSAGLEQLSDPYTWQVVRFTLLQAVLSTALTLVLALPGAYVTSCLAFRGRRALVAVMTVPFVLPTVVVGLAFRQVLPAEWIGTLAAILLAHVFFNYAVVVRVVGGLWGQLDPRYAQAARTLGASPWQVLRTVTWPLLRPAVVAAAVLVFLFTFTSFGVVLLLGGPGTSTLEVQVYRRTAQLLDLPGAAVLAVLQMVLLGVVLLVTARVQAGGAVAQALRPPRSQGLPVRTRGRVVALGGVLVVVAVLLVVPMAALVARVAARPRPLGADVVARAGLDRRRHHGSVAPWASVGVSLRYAVVTSVLAVVVGGLATCAVAYAGRYGGSAGHAGDAAAGDVRRDGGFGMVVAFSHPPLDLRASWWIVPIAHTLVAVPLVLRTALPVVRSIDPRLRQVAATLGAAPVRAWRTVDLPLLGRALAVGAGFAFAVSLGEFGATAFLARTGAPTLPVQIASLLDRPGEVRYGAALALATVLMAVTVLALLATELRPAGHPSGREVTAPRLEPSGLEVEA